MQKTSYSLGPKFFGTTKKSTPSAKKNLGLTKAIDVPQGQEPIRLRSPTLRTLLNGAPLEIERGTHSLKSITGNTPLQTATKSLNSTRPTYPQAYADRVPFILRPFIRTQRESQQSR